MGTANLKRAEQIAKGNDLILQEFGWGFDGFVFPTSRMTAVKVFDNAATYQNELSVYLRLLEHNVVNVLGFAVPRLVNWDDDRRIIEMTSVNPPFIVDFAHANLTSPLTSPMKTSGGQKKQSCLKTTPTTSPSRTNCSTPYSNTAFSTTTLLRATSTSRVIPAPKTLPVPTLRISASAFARLLQVQAVSALLRQARRGSVRGMAFLTRGDRPDAHPAFSLPSILAVVAAIISFKTGAFLGTLMAIAAIVLGLIGALLALSPRVRGGMISIVAIVAGLIGIIAAVFKLVF